jgi:Domain of unknown function (DUF3291)
VPLVAITRLRVRSWRYLPAFFFQTLRTAVQAKRTPGNLAVAVRRDASRTFWTRTVWLDEPAMRSYMSADPHRGVMRSLAEWCDEASVVHWIQDSATPPAWQESCARMQRDGRPSRVNHPSEAHRAYEIPPIRGRASHPPQ